jgi:hypothetical protein
MIVSKSASIAATRTTFLSRTMLPIYPSPQAYVTKVLN